MPLIPGSEHEQERFDGLDLREQSLIDCTFEGCQFVRCSFNGADLTRTRFIDCRFESCDLSNSKLTNARFRDCSLRSCKLVGISWGQLEDLTHPTFNECKMDFSNFAGLKLKKTRFESCSLRDVDFSQSDFSESEFGSADLLNAKFHQTVLFKANFRGAMNYLIDPSENKIRGARFSLPEAMGLLSGFGIILES